MLKMLEILREEFGETRIWEGGIKLWGLGLGDQTLGRGCWGSRRAREALGEVLGDQSLGTGHWGGLLGVRGSVHPRVPSEGGREPSAQRVRLVPQPGAMHTSRLFTLVLVVQPSRVLLGMKKRGFGAGLWNGFGGKVQPGESIEEAARRWGPGRCRGDRYGGTGGGVGPSTVGCRQRYHGSSGQWHPRVTHQCSHDPALNTCSRDHHLCHLHILTSSSLWATGASCPPSHLLDSNLNREWVWVVGRGSCNLQRGAGFNFGYIAELQLIEFK